MFYTLRSATTRPMRDGESEGNPYFFRDEAYFETAPLATYLWVNRAVWRDGMPKWLYGVPEDEIVSHLGENLIYDVIEPQYTRQMIDWFYKNKYDAHYDFKIAHFMPPAQNFNTVASRANMPDDVTVRKLNTCDDADFIASGLTPDYRLQPINGIYDDRLMAHIQYLQSVHQK